MGQSDGAERWDDEGCKSTRVVSVHVPPWMDSLDLLVDRGFALGVEVDAGKR